MRVMQATGGAQAGGGSVRRRKRAALPNTRPSLWVPTHRAWLTLGLTVNLVESLWSKVEENPCAACVGSEA